MAHLGFVFNKGGQSIARIDTSESGTRFAMEGPLRDDEKQAAQDLSSIRVAAQFISYFYFLVQNQALGSRVTQAKPFYLFDFWSIESEEF